MRRVDSKAGVDLRLGAVRWVGPALLGLSGLAAGLLSEPVLYRARPDTFAPMLPESSFTLIFYGPLLAALLAATIAAFRLLVLTSRRAELSALLNLGATRRDLLVQHARRGFTDGAVWGIGGLVLGAIVTQTMRGWSLDFQWNSVWPLLGALVITTASGGAAYAIAAAAVLRGIASAWRAAVAPPGAKANAAPRRRRVKRVALLAAPPVIAAALSVAAWMFGIGGPAIVYPLIAALLVVTVEAIVALTWLGARTALWLSRAAARALAHGGAAGRIAADSLRRPAPGRAAAMAGVVLIVAASAGIGILVNALQARNTLSAELTPDLVITPVAVPSILGIVGDTRLPMGWVTEQLPDALARELETTPGVVVVPAALLSADVTSVSTGVAADVTLLAVDPADLDRIADASGGLFLSGNTTWRVSSGAQTVAVGTTSGSATGMYGPVPFAAVDRAWAEQQFGAAPTSALIVYLPSGSTSGDFIAAHKLEHLYVVSQDPTTDLYPPLSRLAYAIATGVPLAIAVALIMLFALTSMRLRAHDVATLSALGAMRRDLALAAAAEVGILTACAATAGACGGLIVGGAYSVLSYQVAPHSWLAGFGFDLAHAPTGTLAAVVAVATLVAASAAGWLQFVRSRRSPATQLREAIKEGSL